MTYNELSGLILEVAIDIHRRLGPGLLESVYQAILAHELAKRGMNVQKKSQYRSFGATFGSMSAFA